MSGLKRFGFGCGFFLGAVAIIAFAKVSAIVIWTEAGSSDKAIILVVGLLLILAWLVYKLSTYPKKSKL